MERCRSLYLLLANNDSDFHQTFDIIIGLEYREFPCQKEEEDDTSRPHINGFTRRWKNQMSLTND